MMAKRTPKAKPTLVAAAPAITPTPVATPARPLVVDAAAIQRVLIRVLWVVGIGAVLVAIRGSLLTLLFVAVLSFLGAPVVARLERWRVPRSLGAMMFLAMVAVVIIGLVAVVLPPLVRDIARVIDRAPELWATALQTLSSSFPIQIPGLWTELAALDIKALMQRLAPVAEQAGTVGGVVGKGAWSAVTAVLSTIGDVLSAVLVPVLAYFVLAEWPAVRALALKLQPPSWQATTAHYAPRIHESLSALVKGQLIVAAIMAVLYAVGFIVAGVPLGVGIGVLAGAAYVIPFASAAVGLLLAVAFSLLQLGTAAGPAIIGAAVVCVAVQLIEGYLLTPRIVGEKAGLSPLATLLAVFLGGTAAGFLGVLFALPMGAVLAVIIRERR
jgi:predicted PurR-regulated permease PerM